VYEAYAMVRLVADSSALILLAKCGLLETVCDSVEITVSPVVRDEVASDSLVKRYPDALLISDLVSKGKIRMKAPRRVNLSLPISLHKGEEETLMLALEIKGTIFATDDGKAIKAARFLRVPFIISPKIVVEMLRCGKISFIHARESLEKLGKIGRYSPEIIADALALIIKEAKYGKAHNDKIT
jgi:predicted nucleic acid-binding protein